ncbi:choice-of-anchor F family protein [Campylobacterota bacterium]
MKRNIAKMSLVVAMLLSSGAYAGQIIGANPGDPVVDNTQFGFGGWDFTNINVVVFDVDGNPSGTFNTDSGVYTPMVVGDSFISEVISTVDENTLLGSVHGKTYPVGEPAGIKVINGDTGTKHGKPENCIMTTSYLEGAYRNTENPEPVICSSDFQTHKRFKVRMLPAMVTVSDSNGTYFDLKFKLDSNDASTAKVRYQVFQKINNYTGMRLNGYTLEVLDGSGQPNPNLTLSLGIGENPDSNGPDVFGYSEFANFAHGLWGPPDEHFTEQGFFDDVRVYYPVTLNNANNTISYAGPLLGGNYQELFGNWVTNVWAPTGIFFDDDNDPSTDAELVAYWGDPLHTGTIGWHKGEAMGWVAPTTTELLAWEASHLYEMGLIEDVLNLGLNYIVEIGNNASLGNTFTIRITPHTDSNQTAPSHVRTEPIVIIPTSNGVVAISPEPTFTPGTVLYVGVADTDLNDDTGLIETTSIVLKNDNGDEENLTLTETDANSSIFVGTIATDINPAIAQNGVVNVVEGTVVTATYVDESEGNLTKTATTIAQTIVDPIESPVDTEGNSPSSGGGGCTYNPNSKSFDMTFLLMMALGLLYPWRRRLLK